MDAHVIAQKLEHEANRQARKENGRRSKQESSNGVDLYIEAPS